MSKQKQPDWWFLANRLRHVHKWPCSTIAEELGQSKAAVEYATDGKLRQRLHRKRKRNAKEAYIQRILRENSKP